MQHGDPRREAAHEVHVVLDDDDRAIRGDPPEEFARGGSLVLAHAGDGLIEEQHLRVEHEEHRDLQPLLLTVRKDAGRRRALVAESRLLERPLESPDPTPATGPAAARWRIDAGRPRYRDSGGRRARRTRSRLEGPTDSEADDLVHGLAEQLPIAELRRSVPFDRPVIASMQVVLPAPFGPIRKRTSPVCASKETPSTATKPENSTWRSVTTSEGLGAGHLITSSGSGMAAASDGCGARPTHEAPDSADQRRQPLRQEQGDQDEEQAEDVDPPPGQLEARLDCPQPIAIAPRTGPKSEARPPSATPAIIRIEGRCPDLRRRDDADDSRRTSLRRCSPSRQRPHRRTA